MRAGQVTEDAKNASNDTDEELLIDAWREVAALVGRGCPPELALEIAGYEIDRRHLRREPKTHGGSTASSATSSRTVAGAALQQSFVNLVHSTLHVALGTLR